MACVVGGRFSDGEGGIERKNDVILMSLSDGSHVKLNE